MASDPSGDVELTPLNGDARPLNEWLTTFRLVTVVLDPYTNESAWIIETAGRFLRTFNGADCRVAFVVCGTEAEAKQFLGPWTEQILTLCDPDRKLAKSVEIERLPALLHIRQDGALMGAAEGWDPHEWDAIGEDVAKAMSWIAPNLPAPGDPASYAGAPV